MQLNFAVKWQQKTFIKESSMKRDHLTKISNQYEADSFYKVKQQYLQHYKLSPVC